MSRYVSIWFRYLATDWFSLKDQRLKQKPFVLRTPSHGRMVISAANAFAKSMGIEVGMVLADARAIVPELLVLDHSPGLESMLLEKLAIWCIRFTPSVGVDLPDGILLDASGCAHLWGGEEPYLKEITQKLSARGYEVNLAMADTIGAAWAIARFGSPNCVVEKGDHVRTLLSLPPESLRIEPETIERLHKLGLHQVNQFVRIPGSSLRRRFGSPFITRIKQAFGQEEEVFSLIQPPPVYREELPCMEPIVTATGIVYALRDLLEKLCRRLIAEQKGLRKAVFKGYRVDGELEQIVISTNRPSCHPGHLFKLLELKIQTIEPDLGIELFTLEALVVEDHLPVQDKFWNGSGGLSDIRLSELIDRLAGKLGNEAIGRYLPDEHYWPERSYKPAESFTVESESEWPVKSRPVRLLKVPERIEVTAPIPDYPPMVFRYRGALHTIVKADGPERIEQEWWLQQGQHRDYYQVEDERGHRYWLFRSGHYNDNFQWYLHGLFA